MQELPFLHSAHRLMLIDYCMKFREDNLRGFQVTERTRFVTDRQMDRQMDRQTDRRTPGEKQYVSQPFGGRHNFPNFKPRLGLQKYLYIKSLNNRTSNDSQNAF